MTEQEKQMIVDLIDKKIDEIDEQLALLNKDIEHLKIARCAKEAGFTIIKA